ncbi:MAG: type II toxin-antitoxin system PemK/MazF family toxin [Cytophagales bacterium]|nr:type II toxin-antitoxin system PemK/MazF family toxin [Cytophagales bacterium]
MKHAEVWLVDFAPNVGLEVGKVRPVVIVNHDSMGALQLKVVVPVTDAVRSIRDWHIPLIPSKENGISKESVADCFQIKSISKARFTRRLGILSPKEMDEVKLGMMKVLDLL